MQLLRHPLSAMFFFMLFFNPIEIYADSVDVRGDKTEARLLGGIAAAFTTHSEEGLDHTKGDYSTTYSTLGGSLVAQYHFPDFYFEAGLGIMRLTSLTVNSVKIDMKNRVQWHIPLYLHAYYKLHPLFALGTGLTHLTETTMYLDSVPIPDSSYNQIFLDAAAQLSPRITDQVRITTTLIVGLNLIPGRQHTYSIGDLLHLRLQINLGVIYGFL